MAAKEAQINLRLPAELDARVEERAGGKRQKPEFVRRLLERERSREEQEQLVRMFNAAWDSLFLALPPGSHNSPDPSRAR